MFFLNSAKYSIWFYGISTCPKGKDRGAEGSSILWNIFLSSKIVFDSLLTFFAFMMLSFPIQFRSDLYPSRLRPRASRNARERARVRPRLPRFYKRSSARETEDASLRRRSVKNLRKFRTSSSASTICMITFNHDGRGWTRASHAEETRRKRESA